MFFSLTQALPLIFPLFSHSLIYSSTPKNLAFISKDIKDFHNGNLLTL